MAQNSTTLGQQVWVGAGASATMIPEMDIYLYNALCGASPHTTIDDFDLVLVPDLYVGCTVQIHAADANFSGTAMITANTDTSITVDRAVGDADNEVVDVVILGFGAPVPAPTINMRKDTSTAGTVAKPSLLADNWLGLVNTVSPPSVDIELGQVSLALAGRNFGYQFKKNETVSGGSLDLSLNSGAWLYYALGKIASIKHDKTNDNLGTSTLETVTNIADNSVDTTNCKILRAISGATYPPVRTSDSTRTVLTGASWQNVTPNGDFTYGFGETDGDTLPSFALEITHEKDGLATDDYYVGSEGDSDEATARPFKDIYSRIFTGCQVNTYTMNFEEGQEVKANLELVSRRAFDSPVDYVPKRNVRTADGLFNYNGTTESANQPYLFSGGTIEVFGQTVARVKSGSFTINNNIAPQRFIGNYNRQITSAHIPGQRTYEVSLNLLVTDTDIWDNLRAQGENTTETLTLKFQKSATDVIQIQLNDYIVQSLDVPFPEDKGPIEYAMTLSARSLVEGTATPTGTYYKGKWIIQNND
jgi:hypothetical protein